MSIIALDARKYNDYGIGTYIQRLLENFSRIDHPHEFIVYVSPEDEPQISLPRGWKKSPVSYRKYSVGEALFFGSRANKDGATVFHSPHFTLPFGLKRKSVVTIHDLIHVRLPHLFTLVQRAYAYGMIRHAVQDSDRVITDSEFTKQDLLRSFPVDEKKIEVIHLGVGNEFAPVSDAEKKQRFRERFGLQRPYVLFVGNIKPHKGVAQLLRAFKEVHAVVGDIDLVFVGGQLSRDSALAALSKELGIEGSVKELGRLASEDLVLAYGSAEVFVLPSEYEGFGLPALEAMACGVPVIVSDHGALTELVGNGAIAFKTGDSIALFGALRTLLEDSGKRADLGKKGMQRSSMFRWEDAAQKTLAVYNSLV